MASPKILVYANNKGGVGKSTSTVNSAAALALLGKSVLVVDFDPQSNSTSSLLPDLGLKAQRSVKLALQEEEPQKQRLSLHACPTRIENLEIVPNDITCMDWEAAAGQGDGVDALHGLSRLIRKDEDLNNYDYIVIDTPPNIGVMLRNALTVADYVIVPIPVGDQYALDGFSVLLNVMTRFMTINTELNILGVVLTKFDGRSGQAHVKNRERIRKTLASYGIPVFKSEIGVNVDLDRAHTARSTIFEYQPNKKKSGAEDYTELAKEIIELTEG